jgi:PAS domain S-box-containing protein
MADNRESDDETEQLGATTLEAETTILQIRQRAEQEIRRSNTALEERTKELAQALVVMRATLESTTDAIVVTDEKLRVTEFNEKYIDMWKIPRGALERGMVFKMRELTSQSSADPQEFISRVEAIVASDRESFDLLELKEGRVIERYSKVLTVDGQGAGRVWSFRDVTERHLAEITFRQLGAIVASSDDAIIGKDLKSIITSWNAGAERIFGYTAEEMIGTSIMRLIPPDRRDEEREILSRIRSGERLEHFETVRVAKDGKELNVSITVSPIKDFAGHVVGASKVARDITQRKAAEREAERVNRERLRLLDSEREARSEAERANRLKDEFLATLSHELRTPLNAVLGWVNILRVGKLQGEDRKQAIDTIERNARIQAQIIEDLLDMSRIISGKVGLDVQRIELPAVINAAVETLRAESDSKGVDLRVQVDSVAEPISGDPNRLQQVFWNLLHNAIKFTPKGGTVQVVLQLVDPHMVVKVIDTGEGIAPEFMPHVFERFQQGDPSTTRSHGGLGLGLAIVKQLIELHGGSVSVESGGIKQGATFTVQLPLIGVYAKPDKERTRSPAALREDRLLPEVSLDNLHVLVVDDEIDAREVVKKLLEMAGATVLMASSASEAMEQILARRPDVLVCDIAMPGEDGYSLVRRLRMLEASQEYSIPALALSAYARSEDRTKAFRAGFQNHLAKPIEPSELLAVVKTLAARKIGRLTC